MFLTQYSSGAGHWTSAYEDKLLEVAAAKA